MLEFNAWGDVNIKNILESCVIQTPDSFTEKHGLDIETQL